MAQRRCVVRILSSIKINSHASQSPLTVLAFYVPTTTTATRKLSIAFNSFCRQEIVLPLSLSPSHLHYLTLSFCFFFSLSFFLPSSLSLSLSVRLCKGRTLSQCLFELRVFSISILPYRLPWQSLCLHYDLYSFIISALA